MLSEAKHLWLTLHFTSPAWEARDISLPSI